MVQGSGHPGYDAGCYTVSCLEILQGWDRKSQGDLGDFWAHDVIPGSVALCFVYFWCPAY